MKQLFDSENRKGNYVICSFDEMIFFCTFLVLAMSRWQINILLLYSLSQILLCNNFVSCPWGKKKSNLGNLGENLTPFADLRSIFVDLKVLQGLIYIYTHTCTYICILECCKAVNWIGIICQMNRLLKWKYLWWDTALGWAFIIDTNEPQWPSHIN